MEQKSDGNADVLHVSIDIVQGQVGAEFSPSDLAIPVGAFLVWTNQTADPQVFQVGRRVITLAPRGQDGAVGMTRASTAETTFAAHLQSNPAALVTINVMDGTA